MAINLLAKNSETKYCVFSIDSDGDIENLPTESENGKSVHEILHACCPGSIARSIDGSKYVLTGENSWVKYVDKSSSSDDEVAAIDDTYIDSLFE